ncbi:MAG: Na+/H+ antiporter NhaA [Solirubrobacteraceae bacterium]|nr:Na+/H+ antiporter NhaA [Solirubrobacteraceae bacterium]
MADPAPPGPGHRWRVRRGLGAALEFIRNETVGGAILLVAAVVAVVWANVGDGYEALWTTELTIGAGPAAITEDLRHWVNDGLMVLFFFVVALEVKRELVVGELTDRRAAVVPVLGAVGGVAVPAVVFLVVTGTLGDGEATRGWAIPAATDIAFAVGVLALLSRWVPAALKLLLLTVAIVDDVIAIAIIALFYSSGLSPAWLAAVLVGLATIVGMRVAGVRPIVAYVPIGIAVWVAMLESGVHATIAGVTVGLLTPARPVAGRPVLELLVHRLHPFTVGFVVPLFALANAGIAIDSEMLSDAATSPIAWGIALGLVLGKLLGIAGTIFLLVHRGVGTIPDTVRTVHVWGLAAVAGIGFTVSLFITQLAYDAPAVVDTAKLGVFAGSIISAAVGATILIRAGRTTPGDTTVAAPDPIAAPRP